MITFKRAAALLISSTLAIPAFSQSSSEQLIQLGNYINSNVDPKIVKEVQKLNQCGIIAVFFDSSRSDRLLDQSYERLLSVSAIDKKTAENYIRAGNLFFTNTLIKKKYIDPNNLEGDNTINATKGLYKNMCAGL